MDQTRSRNNPPTRFRPIVSTLCMPAHCYFIPAVHAERRPATQIHPHKSGQAETTNPSNQKNKIRNKKKKKKKNALTCQIVFFFQLSISPRMIEPLLELIYHPGLNYWTFLSLYLCSVLFCLLLLLFLLFCVV